MKLIIRGKIKGGKNSMCINPRTGAHYPKKDWAVWRDGVVLQLKSQNIEKKMISVPCIVCIDYYPGDRIHRDVPAMLDSVWHCCERSGIILNDSLFEDVFFTRMQQDKENPRAEIVIEPKSYGN